MFEDKWLLLCLLNTRL